MTLANPVSTTSGTSITMSIPAWIFAVVAALAVAGLVALAMRRSGSGTSGEAALPEEWPLIQRSIFSAEERSLYRQLRAALPHHTILAKLPLVRFCQPMDRNELGYWFKLLGPIHVSFVVCAENGRVLAALDIERASRPTAKRAAVRSALHAEGPLRGARDDVDHATKRLRTVNHRQRSLHHLDLLHPDG